MIIALVVGITALVGVSALFAERYGAVGVACLAGILIVGLLVVLVLPDTAWNRLTGADTTADDLGVLTRKASNYERHSRGSRTLAISAS